MTGLSAITARQHHHVSSLPRHTRSVELGHRFGPAQGVVLVGLAEVCDLRSDSSPNRWRTGIRHDEAQLAQASRPPSLTHHPHSFRRCRHHAPRLAVPWGTPHVARYGSGIKRAIEETRGRSAAAARDRRDAPHHCLRALHLILSVPQSGYCTNWNSPDAERRSEANDPAAATPHSKSPPTLPIANPGRSNPSSRICLGPGIVSVPEHVGEKWNASVNDVTSFPATLKLAGVPCAVVPVHSPAYPAGAGSVGLEHAAAHSASHISSRRD